MTKALHCALCNAVKSFAPDGAITACDCTMVKGWWIDPIAGTAQLYIENQANREQGHIISLHNGFLIDGPRMIPKTYIDQPTKKTVPFPIDQANVFWRQLHQQAGIAPRAPETVRIFDQSLRACWAVIVVPGTTADTSWATEQEFREHGGQVAVAQNATTRLALNP